MVLALVATVLLIILIRRKPERIVRRLQENFSGLQNRQDRLELVIKDEISRNRQETTRNAQRSRQELGASLKLTGDSLQQRLAENVRVQKDSLDSFSKQLMAMARLNEEKMESMRKTMGIHLRAMQADNTKKLEQMRAIGMRNCIRPWKSDWVNLFDRSVSAWNRSIKDWAKCNVWQPVSAI
jgi:DNA recombination protein RmuC